MAVSILVFVELAPGLLIPLFLLPIFMFQSLFLWNSRPDGVGHPGDETGLMFQSLFLWNSRPDHCRCCRPGRDASVSILVFVELAPGLGEYADDLEMLSEAVEFQSLFLWNSRPDINARIGQVGMIQFQSLFLWNSRPDILADGAVFACHRVSILVFVELAPGHRTHVLCGLSSRVSILVFVELAPGRVLEIPQCAAVAFQSLFLWNSRPDASPWTAETMS